MALAISSLAWPPKLWCGARSAPWHSLGHPEEVAGVICSLLAELNNLIISRSSLFHLEYIASTKKDCLVGGELPVFSSCIAIRTCRCCRASRCRCTMHGCVLLYVAQLYY